ASPKDKINSLMQKDRTGLNLIERFQAIADADGYNPELNTSVWRSRFSNILALACVASATYGLSNFVGLGQDMGESIFRSSAAGTYITGPMAGISMGIMGALTASFGLTVGDRLVGSESRLYPHILPSYTRHWLMGSALVVCALGGMPNVFQSIYIDQPAAGAAFAEIASFLLELFGYLESRYDANETSTMKKFKPEYKELVASVMNLIQSMKYATADHAGPTALKQAIQSAKAKLQACKAKDDAPAELSVALLETSRTGQGRPVMPIMNGLSEPSYYDDSNASYLNRPMTI
ncbi:MAG: hypothetical protein K0Q57_1078, partial [Gammaproteobacteria bacterium]|nr:hypothetical protein [Gammaproteobacteria bacterium]